MTAAGRARTKPTHQRFEALSSSLSVRDIARDSHVGSRAVRPTYCSLAGQVAQTDGDLSFGKVSKHIGAVGEKRLADASRIQASGRKTPQGEIPVDLGWVGEATIDRAVEEQSKAPSVAGKIVERPS